MGLLDGFEKLINEHGSAVILKERIELANDKYSALEQKAVALEQRVTVLDGENKTLHHAIEEATNEINSLKEIIEESQTNTLSLKYGVYWDKNGNPFCPKCKTPTSQISWATYVNKQIHALKCSCSEKPFVLMSNGEPIHAQEAMKLMQNP